MKVQIALAAGVLILSASAIALKSSQAIRKMEPGVRYLMSPALAQDLGIDFEKITQALGTDSVTVALDTVSDQLDVTSFDPETSASAPTLI